MKFSDILKSKREALGLTQQALADQIYVTRQTISRWENDLAYPNLDTLIELSSLSNMSLDQLLKGEGSDMVKQISADVKAKKRYKRYLVAITIILAIILAWLVLLGFGRARQIETIDRFNPFLSTRYGYAILPNKVPTRQERITETDSHGKHKRVVWSKVPQRVDAYVSDDPFGSGEWLKFYTSEYNSDQRWALVAHKGSYVSAVRLVKKNQIPLSMREQAGSFYTKYDQTAERRVPKRFPWWPFN